MTHARLYVHIPFCKKKCHYCDFLSFANLDPDLIQMYIEALIPSPTLRQDFDEFSRVAQCPPFPTLRRGNLLDNLWISTIYIGGGTPTLLSEIQLEKLISSIVDNFQIDGLKNGKNNSPIEFSIEANPGTVDVKKLKLLKNLGVNRLSIGAQSFSDEELKTLGRIHSSKEIYESVKHAIKTGFSNINLDLIFAIPGQTLKSWQKTLEMAIKLNPTHISTYNLQIEEGTYFHNNRRNFEFLDDEKELEMYKTGIEFLKSHGYVHYEISNFAKPGFECKHNINYWENGNYIGLGLGASSHFHGQRWQNSSNLDEYLKELSPESRELRKIKHNFPLTSASSTELSETIFMGLRVIKGINLTEFEKRFGISLLDKYSKEIEQLLNDELVEQDNNSLRLSEKGLYLGNEVFERFV